MWLVSCLFQSGMRPGGKEMLGTSRPFRMSTKRETMLTIGVGVNE